MTDNLNGNKTRSLNAQWREDGEYVCDCGHWTFEHELRFLGWIFHTNHGRWCHQCTCDKVRRHK